jgi:hypothetical protein
LEGAAIQVVGGDFGALQKELPGELKFAAQFVLPWAVVDADGGAAPSEFAVCHQFTVDANGQDCLFRQLEGFDYFQDFVCVFHSTGISREKMGDGKSTSQMNSQVQIVQIAHDLFNAGLAEGKESLTDVAHWHFHIVCTIGLAVF